MPLLYLCGLFPDIPKSFSLFEAHSEPSDWTKEAHAHAFASHLVTHSGYGKTIDHFLHVLHFFMQVCNCILLVIR